METNNIYIVTENTFPEIMINYINNNNNNINNFNDMLSVYMEMVKNNYFFTFNLEKHILLLHQILYNINPIDENKINLLNILKNDNIESDSESDLES